MTTRCHGSLCTAKSRASQNGPIEIQECSIALALALLGRNDIYFRRRDFKGRRSWLRSARSSSPAKRCSRSSASRQFGQLRGLSEWQSFPTPSRQACSETGQHLEHGLGRSRARALEGTGFEPSVPGGPRRLRRLRLRPARRRNPTTARFSARFVAREFQRPGSRLLAIDPLRHLKKLSNMAAEPTASSTNCHPAPGKAYRGSPPGWPLAPSAPDRVGHRPWTMHCAARRNHPRRFDLAFRAPAGAGPRFRDGCPRRRPELMI